jgi:hypothetical protein
MLGSQSAHLVLRPEAERSLADWGQRRSSGQRAPEVAHLPSYWLSQGPQTSTSSNLVAENIARLLPLIAFRTLQGHWTISRLWETRPTNRTLQWRPL